MPKKFSKKTKSHNPRKSRKTPKKKSTKQRSKIKRHSTKKQINAKKKVVSVTKRKTTPKPPKPVNTHSTYVIERPSKTHYVYRPHPASVDRLVPIVIPQLPQSVTTPAPTPAPVAPPLPALAPVPVPMGIPVQPRWGNCTSNAECATNTCSPSGICIDPAQDH